MANPGCSGLHKRGLSEIADGNDRQPGGIFGNGLQGRREEENGILADTNGLRLEYGGKEQNGTGEQNLQEQSERSGATAADTQWPGLERQREDTRETPFSEFRNDGTQLPDTGNIWSVEWQRKLRSDKQTVRGGEDNGRGTEINAIWEWWATEPPVYCLVDGLPPGMDGYEGRICYKSYQRVSQLKGLGNAIVPHIAMLIWLMIKELL
jgi:hypothetical protein